MPDRPLDPRCVPGTWVKYVGDGDDIIEFSNPDAKKIGRVIGEPQTDQIPYVQMLDPLLTTVYGVPMTILGCRNVSCIHQDDLVIVEPPDDETLVLAHLAGVI